MPPLSTTYHSKRDRLTHWADQQLESPSPLMRFLHSLVRIILITLQEADKNTLSLRSGALTYTILLSLVPMLAMSTAVIKGLGGSDQLRDVVYSYIDTLEQTAPELELGGADEKEAELPSDSTEPADAASLTAHLRSGADQLFDYVDRTNFVRLGTFGMLGIFLSVILVLNHIEAAMNTIWRITTGRSVLRKITDYLTLLVLLPITINIALAAGAILESQSLTGYLDRFIPAEWIQALLLNGIPIFFLTITLYVIYIFFPNTRPKTFPALAGALLAGTLWFATQNLYISMQIGVSKYNAIYGSFATFPLFLVWIYFGWLFVLLGAQVAYAIEKRKNYQLIRQSIAPALQLSAAIDIIRLITSRFQDRESTTFDQITHSLVTYSSAHLKQVLSELVRGNILHYAQGGGEIMPSLPAEKITNQHIIEVIFGSDLPESEGGLASKRVLQSAVIELENDFGPNQSSPSPETSASSDSTEQSN